MTENTVTQAWFPAGPFPNGICIEEDIAGRLATTFCRRLNPFASQTFRMMEHTSIHVRRADHVGFAVASLDESLRFWVDGLGAQLVRTGEMGGEFLGQVTGAHGAQVRMAIISLAGQTIELLEYRGLNRSTVLAKPFDPGFAHLALVVDDIDAILARIATYGWKAQGIPQPIASGARAGTRVIYVVGPDGATIEFMQPPASVQDL
ncbi:VOC family protein [Aureimonas phyllosphaerae]|uniref:VOC family protein n=1 Tax=Aureimonas phyllosphaerae TaxID=1166078 RepID=UPI003A5C1908